MLRMPARTVDKPQLHHFCIRLMDLCTWHCQRVRLFLNSVGSFQFDIEVDVPVMLREENTVGWWKLFKIFLKQESRI